MRKLIDNLRNAPQWMREEENSFDALEFSGLCIAFFAIISLMFMLEVLCQ